MKKSLTTPNYVEEREKKSIRSVSTLYTWELSYSLAFSVLLQASMGPDVIICVCGCESAFLLILKASIKGLVWLKGFQVCSSTLAFQRSFWKHWICKKKDVCHHSCCIGPLSSTSKHLDFQLTQEELWISCWQTGLDVFSMSLPWKAAFDSVSQHWTYPQKPPRDSKEGQASGHNTSPNCLFCAKAAYSNNMRIVCLELPQSPRAPRGTGEHRRSLWLVSLGWQTCGQSVVLG